MNQDKPATRLSDVTPKEVDWLWPGYLPLGKLVAIIGDQDVGKSLFTLDIAARVTTGKEMPDHSPGKDGGVVIVAEEDDPDDTIVPRLLALGADTSRIVHFGPENHIRVPQDIKKLGEEVDRVKARLLIIDPILGHLNGNTYKDQEVRRNLAPLVKLTREKGVTVLLIAHLNKDSKKDIQYRTMGSTAMTAVPRVALLIGLDPDDKDRHIIAKVKNNLSKVTPSLSFHTLDVDGIPTTEWDEEECTTTAMDLVKNFVEDERPLSNERQRVLTAAMTLGRRFQAKEIANLTGMKTINVSKLLSLMVKDGQMTSPAYGWYEVRSSVLDEVVQTGKPVEVFKPFKPFKVEDTGVSKDNDIEKEEDNNTDLEEENDMVDEIDHEEDIEEGTYREEELMVRPENGRSDHQSMEGLKTLNGLNGFTAVKGITDATSLKGLNDVNDVTPSTKPWKSFPHRNHPTICYHNHFLEKGGVCLRCKELGLDQNS